MPIIEVVTHIDAPIDLCFDLARDIDVHIESTKGTEERAIGGIRSGLINLGEEVTWEANHFGGRHRLTSRITAFHRPFHFRDSQVSGPFHRFDHDHYFQDALGSTTMRDVFDYESPFGWLGRCADLLFLRRHMTEFLRRRARVIKQTAERRGAADSL
jgi:ligand-binding SRPBCC domain-containing protein